VNVILDALINVVDISIAVVVANTDIVSINSRILSTRPIKLFT